MALLKIRTLRRCVVSGVFRIRLPARLHLTNPSFRFDTGQSVLFDWFAYILGNVYCCTQLTLQYVRVHI